jgi:hypothetical protein
MAQRGSMEGTPFHIEGAETTAAPATEAKKNAGKSISG